MSLNPFTHQIVKQLGGRVGNPLTKVWDYTYATATIVVAQDARESSTISIDAGTDFFIQEIQLSAFYNAATTPTGAVTNSKIARLTREFLAEMTGAHVGMIDVLFQTLNRPWMNRAVRADLVTGDAVYPHYLKAMVYVPANDSIRVEVTNNLPTIGGQNPTIDVQVAFVGIKAEREVSNLLLTAA